MLTSLVLVITFMLNYRGFLGINPDRGSETKKARSSVNKKVLSIIQRIAEVEWSY